MKSAITGAGMIFLFFKKHQKPKTGFKRREYEREEYIPEFNRFGFDSHCSYFFVVV
jgi:hypothetical protein